MRESHFSRLSRAAALLGTLILGVACSGDSKSPTEVNPGPPPPPQPTAMVIVAGDGQSAVTSTAVAIGPSVKVTDSKGNAISGVQVTFSVTQGGGSVTGATQTTGSNGTATVGSWTLGPQAGLQKLSATAASLTPVTFSATATSPEPEPEPQVITQNIDASGGSVVVNWPDSPLKGATLSLDPGALGSNSSITLSAAPLTGLNLPAGVTALTPGLGISGASGELGASAALTLPVPAGNDGKLLMLAMADPVSGNVTILPSINQTANSLTALLPTLDARSALASRFAPSRVFGLFAPVPGNPASDEAELPSSLTFMVALNPELLDRDFDTGFRPGVDDWDFPRMAIADLPFLKSPANADQSFAAADDGLTATALWYYVNRRRGGGPQLNGSTQLLAGEPLSSRAGIRWAALAEKNVPPINQTGSLLIKDWGEWVASNGNHFLWLQFQGIKALMLTTLEQPVPVILLDTDNPDDFQNKPYPMAIAYRTVGNTLYLAWPGSPGTPVQVQFSESGMTPFTLSNPNGSTVTVRAIGGVHYLNVASSPRLASQWSQVSAGTIGRAEGWPEATLHWEKAQLDTSRVYLADELRMWWQCAGCADKVSNPPQLPATASHVQRFQSIRVPSEPGKQLSALFSSAELSANDMFQNDEKQVRQGFVLWHPVADEGAQGSAVGWLDWQTVVFRKLELTPSESELKISSDTTITLTVTPSETPPAGTSYRWLLRTDEGADSVETTTPSHTRDLEDDTSGWLIFSALEGPEKRVIARDSIKVSAEPKIAAWRILTLNDAGSLLDDIDPVGNEASLLVRLVQSPTSGLIQVMEEGDQSTLVLRVKRNGSWSESDCCTLTPINTSTERSMPLGYRPPVNYSMGPFFSAWNSSYWSETSDKLDAGTVTGQYIMGLTSYKVKDAGNQTGPAGAIRIQATRNGTSMTGAMSVFIWWVDDNTGELSGGADSYNLPFTAVRMR